MTQQPTLTAPLFRTSLRSWQASWKASQAAAGAASTDAPRAVNLSRQDRAGRRKRRPSVKTPS
jgi:hypothetical protein